VTSGYYTEVKDAESKVDLRPLNLFG